MKILQIVSLALLLCFNIYAQPFSNWSNHTDKTNAADVAVSGTQIWAATGGGAYGWNSEDSSFITLTKTDGLQSIFLTSVTIDNSGKVWFGSSNGIISVYDPSSNSIKSILDIFNSDRTSKRINELKTVGDTIIVSTDFGVSLIDPLRMNFYDTFFRFGDFTSYTKVNSTFKSDRYYVATEAGVAIQKSGAVNLSAPESWDVYRVQEGLRDNSIRRIVSYNNMIIAATRLGMSFFNGTSWENFLPAYEGNVTDLHVVNTSVPGAGGLFFTMNNIVYFLHEDGTVTEHYGSAYLITRVTSSEQYGIVAATTGGVTTGGVYIVPNGPRSNQFNDMAVDNDGSLWIATGVDPAGVGTNKFDGSTWINYNISTDPGMVTNAIYSVYTSPDNKKSFGTWGRGIVIYDGSEFINYGITNSGMVGIQNDPNYLVVTGTAVDSRNNLWALNYGSAELKNLSMLTPDQQWHHFKVTSEANLYLNQHMNLVIDNYDTKWYSVNDINRQGLFYFNENKTYGDPADDRSGFITTDQGIANNAVRSIAVDRRGDIWVGTSQGLTIISNTGSILGAGNPQLNYFPVFALRQQSINAIAVDPLNNKWIGTNQGLLYVNSDGSALLAALDSRNSPLISDEILSLAIDPNTGTIYAGTDAGLTAFKTVAVNPYDTFTDLNIYPNPFKLQRGFGKLTIDGLVRESDIKILSVSGKVVFAFASPGGRVAFWDGNDFSGNPVSSGIYLIVASDKEGNNVITGKVAVLRE